MSQSAIDKLSQSVQKTVTEVKNLRRENDRLREKAAKVEQRLEALPASSAAEDSWREERDQVRQRMEKLAEHLEGVLAEP